ncbi:MAG: hypothetical protein V4736_07265 [Bdellovibrionota bacterium]
MEQIKKVPCATCRNNSYNIIGGMLLMLLGVLIYILIFDGSVGRYAELLPFSLFFIWPIAFQGVHFFKRHLTETVL